MKRLFENWRRHLKEGDNSKVRELLCQAMEELFGANNLPAGGLITIESKGNKKQFVITKKRGGIEKSCVLNYTGPTDLQVALARGLGGPEGYDEPTGMPLEEELDTED